MSDASNIDQTFAYFLDDHDSENDSVVGVIIVKLIVILKCKMMFTVNLTIFIEVKEDMQCFI